MLDFVIPILLGLFIGAIVGFVLKSIFDKQTGNEAKKQASELLESAKLDADKRSKEILAEAKAQIADLRQNAERDIKERTRVVTELEERIVGREERLDQRALNLDKRESAIDGKESAIEARKLELDEKNSKVDALITEQEEKLIAISGLSQETAKAMILERVEREMDQEIAIYMREAEAEAKTEADRKSKVMLANAILQYSNDATQEKTVSVVTLPSDDMKGRIIGREGRNIRALESLTGVDVIIDDTPEAVVLSGFDPIRREIAKRSLEILVSDGRIHPGRIEEVVEKMQKDIDQEIREAGEQAVFDTGIGRVHPDLIKLIGRLKYRTSYGQNVLKHSMEVAFFTGKLAVELGENELLARRAGLLHDIGKAVDHEVDGSHVDIGIDLCTRYNEKPEVINSIASHHGDQPHESIIAVLVTAADKLSAARPGARSEAMENYIKRLRQLEEISNAQPGVDKSYAIQAGREVRVIVKPDQVNDIQAYQMARDIREEIEKSMTYPGTVKVTVIRETRAFDVAK
jgi:ribonucrease Y